MLRIHFTGEDLERTRLAEGPEPMWEVLLSLHKLTDGQARMVFDGWRREVHPKRASWARWLPLIAPPTGYSPDFLTPAVEAGSLEVGLDHVLSTPRRCIRMDIARLARERRPSGPTAELADGGRTGLRWLERALRDYHRVALAPFWDRIRSRVLTDLTVRREDQRRGGIERMLATLHPRARWSAPVLELPYPTSRDVHLDGRGLRIIPSFFCWGTPYALCDVDPIPALAYPVQQDLNWLADAGCRPSERALTALLGRTRATVLSIIAAEGGCSTSGLARQAGVSIASASQHATVLREAGLITSVRHGGSVIHTIRHPGQAVLEGSAAS
ncbi:helix-turn-helix transcriptional regulator [Actinomadura barringtoniae]|uniref:Helix-turn-helix transcriptional regulator n=1 Tax=Actinomadura barringtoniae TaxID=1427535 RepID=A0A939PHE3_9ACTN|nr:helix-turn-helix domain-containing protein [Actinomadura barringtoniae]MBO2452700.1 helix-turn-helix transcriptional regulator [Actinomadura barringtoniae]